MKVEPFALPPHFIYRGEGNSSVVLALPKSHRILRLYKKEKPKTILDWFVNLLKKIFNWDCKTEIERETANLKFYMKVMRTLVGKQFACEAKQVYLSRKHIKRLDENLLSLRPEHRREKHLQHGRATIFDDYAFLPKSIGLNFSGATYAVEVKPKQAWLPHIQQDFKKCVYCTNQYLKLRRGQISSISSYCPFDLFSGEPQRMEFAIRSLIENPQNNFKLFVNGVCMYDENKSTHEFYDLIKSWFEDCSDAMLLQKKFCQLISGALLTSFEDIDDCDHNCKSPLTSSFFDHNKQKISECTEISGENLPENCVLKKVLNLQQFDTMGWDNYLLYKNNCDIDDWSYIDELLREIDRDSNRCSRCVILRIIRGSLHPAQIEQTMATKGSLFFVPYLIASVARDCSIMLTFRKIDECEVRSSKDASNGVKIIEFGSQRYALRIGLLDLYPKPMSTIEKHCKRTEQMHRAYLDCLV